jgi:hypothetical protein
MASNTEYLQLPPKSKQRAARADRTRWIPPPSDVLKINTDAAFIAQEKSGAWGFVIRDCGGHGVMEGSGRIRAVHDALAAAGEACLAALYAAMDIGIWRIILETDSSNLATALRSASFDQSPGGVIYREARDLLDLHFVSGDVCAIPRSCNPCAHELAHSGLDRDPDAARIWNDPLPEFVIELVSDGLTTLSVE